MEAINNNIFTGNDKLIIYSLLTRVMDADKVRKGEEISFLENITAALSMTKEDIEQASKLSLEECKEEMFTFDDKQRAEIKRILVGMAYADGVYVKQEEELIESLKLDISRYELELIAEWRDEEQKIVGFYTCKNDGRFCIEDIRSLRFSELKYKDDGEIKIDVNQITDLKLNKYYEFSWTTELDDSERGFHVIPREYKFKEVQAKELVNRLYNNWKDKDYDTIKQMSEVQRMVNTQLTASSDGTFIYELLQNANDYPVVIDNHVQLVDVEFHITDHYLIYRHTGRYFSPRNIAAISKMSDGEKKKEKNAIGYKGIGFKTVFSENQYVYLESGEYTLRFDESITRKGLGSSKFPWQLMPIWTTKKEVAQEVINAMQNAQDFRVQMAIRPDDTSKLRSGEKSYEFIFNDIFKDEKDILFIPNIKSVKVFYDGDEQICRTKDPEKWVLTEKPLVYKFTDDEIEENNREVISNKRIPEKYKDFEDTRVSFACQRDGRKIIPVEKARIYCYLPTQVSLGFPFLMNTDMIPTGPRDDFEKKIKFNHKIMKIAGGKLAEWISSLLHSGEYDLCSVFTIVPSFDEVENYEDFIEEFKEGFDSQLDGLEFIPCENGEYSVIYDTIIDETGLLSSGIITDDEFFELSDWGGSLPAKELRTNRKFKSFVKKYIDSSNIFDKDALLDMVRGDKFKEWLKNLDNNNKFLKFLLDNNYLEDFLNEKIFIDDKGALQKADDIYFDIDKYLVDLQAFIDYIDFLSPKTREFFKDSKEWANTIKDVFAEFDCDDFVNNVLLSRFNISETIEKIQDKDTSIHFYKFLAENVSFESNYTELPFINDKNDVVDSFDNRFVFFSSEKGHQVCESSWLSPIDIEFISNEYTKETNKYFTENFSVRDFADEIIIKEIVLSDDYKKEISDGIIDNYDVSKDFVKYCYSHKSLFDSGSLNSYRLKVYDGEGEEQWYTADGEVFFPSPRYDYYAAKTWLGSSLMVALENDYFKDVTNSEDIKQFIADAFGVEELTEYNFYLNVVKPNKDAIIAEVSGDKDKNVDFVKYLDDNYELIFVENRDAELFSNYEVVSITTNDLTIDGTVYVYCDELVQITEQEWFPDDLVYICNKEYGDSPALKAIGCKQFNFSDFYNEVLIEEISTINDYIDTVEKSVSFHNFIISNLRVLTTEQQEKMANAKVFLYGGEESNEAGGHKTLSAKAKELFDKKLVEFSDLDIIDPLYNTDANTEYWENRLGNTKFTVTHFFTWLKENSDSFSDTIRDESMNVVFWRWVKSNVTISEKLKEEIPALPILINGNEFADSSDAIYFSDSYLEGKSLETYVKRFDENALFLSPAYITEDDNLDSWIQFWNKIGVKQEILDVIIETIIPGLSDIEDESLPKLFAEYRKKLEEHYGNELISNLTGLRVKGRGGDFYSLNECIYIDCEKEEPFVYIELPNQITFNTGEERRLIKELIDECDGDCVSTLSEWQQRKVDRYLEMQNDNEDSIRDFHYQFINDLSVIRNSRTDSLKEIERVKEICLLNRNNEFCTVDDLTMGSVYNPFFDFEQCEIDLNYVSDNYNEKSSEYTGRLFRSMGMHCDFKTDDVDYLEQRICAVYFWNSYLTKQTTDISYIIDNIIDDHLLDDISCIPTKDYMKSPTELYYGAEVSRYVKSIEDWENKIPLKDLPEIKLSDDSTIFERLPFKDSLDFLDALYALVTIQGQDKRTQLLRWMIDSYDEEYDNVIHDYREDEHATWLNTKNDPVQIKDLYALDYWNKSLEQYFGSNNPRIINKNYLPAGDSFKSACDILGIKTICADDLMMVPEDETLYTAANRTLKLFALVIAGKIDYKGWQDRYNDYCNKLDTLSLHRCSSIKISYKEDDSINQTLKKFYHEKGSDDFYFVKELDDKRVFQYFVKEYLEYLGIKDDDIAIELVEDIMDSEENALKVAKEDNTLMIDDDYKNELVNLIPDIKRELSGNMAIEDDEDNTSVHRPSFTTIQSDEGDDTDDSIVDDEESDGRYEWGNYQEEISNYDSYNHDEYDEPDEDEGTFGNEDDNSEYTSHALEENNPSTSKRQIPPYQKPEMYNDVEGDASQEAYGTKSGTDSQSTSNSGNSSIDNSTSETDSSQSQETSITEHQIQSENTRSDDYTPQPHSYSNNRPHSVPKDVPTPKYNPIDELAEYKEKQVFNLEEGDYDNSDLEHYSELFEGGLTQEEIKDQSTLVKTRVYNDFIEHKLDLEMSEAEFIKKTKDKNNFVVKTKTGTYIHVKSAFNGILYLSPTFWNRVQLESAVVCVILSHKAKNFLYIHNHEELEKLIGGDSIFVQVKGADKIGIVNQLFGKSLIGAKNKVFTMLRVKTGGKLDYLFQPARSEWDEDEDEQYIDNL